MESEGRASCSERSNGHVAVLARAKHTFQGRNNDELSLHKGDVVTVTQQLEGGWWEGTLHSNTGWFPADYVTILPDGLMNAGMDKEHTENGAELTSSNRHTYRQQIMTRFEQCEWEWVNSMSKFYNDILLNTNTVMAEGDKQTLEGNMSLLLTQHSELCECIAKSVQEGSNAKLGGVMLRAAPMLRQVHASYCDNHPKAVALLLNYKDELNRIAQQQEWTMKEFIAGLSLPFRHLDTYCSMLNELERSTVESHPDRGDTQRAASVYRHITTYCASVRQQKEMQLELLSQGSVPGVELCSLGDVLYMGMLCIGQDSCDRCVVLFVSSILVLEVTNQTNVYQLDMQLPTEGTLSKTDSNTDLYLSNVDNTRKLVMHITTHEQLNVWLEAFAKCPNLRIDDSCSNALPIIQPQSIEVGSIRNLNELSPLRRAEVSQLPSAITADNAKSERGTGLRLNHELEMVLPESTEESGKEPRVIQMYSGFCLRPLPISRLTCAVDYSNTNVTLRRALSQTEQEDVNVLKIIEGYCAVSHKTSDGVTPQLLLAEHEKIFVEELIDQQVVVRERSLIDTVYALKDQLNHLQREMGRMSKTVEREQKARRRLEESFRSLKPTASP